MKRKVLVLVVALCTVIGSVYAQEYPRQIEIPAKQTPGDGQSVYAFTVNMRAERSVVIAIDDVQIAHLFNGENTEIVVPNGTHVVKAFQLRWVKRSGTWSEDRNDRLTDTLNGERLSVEIANNAKLERGRKTKLPAVSAAPASVPAGGVPRWFLSPPKSDDAIYGRGTAKFADLNMSISTAEARARTAVSFTLTANIEAMVIDFNQTAGNSNTQSNLTFVQNISRQLTASRLNGVEVQDSEVGPDGTVYVLVVMSKADAKKNFEDKFKEPEVAQYAAFKADEALRMLDAQISKQNVEAATKDN
jgi:hypothetical protein